MTQLGTVISGALGKLIELGLRLCLALLMVLLVTMAVIAAFARNQDFTEWVLQDLVPRVNPTLEFGQNHGGFLSPDFALDSVVYRDQAGGTIVVDEIALDWSPADLWSKSLNLNALSIGEIKIAIAAREGEQEQASDPFSLEDIELPLSVSIGLLSIERLQISHTEDNPQQLTPIALSQIKLVGSAMGSRVTVDELHTRLSQGDLSLTLDASATLETRLDWALDAQLLGDIAGLPVAGSGVDVDSELHYKLSLSESLNNLKLALALTNSNGKLNIHGDANVLDPLLPVQLNITTESLQLATVDSLIQPTADIRVSGDLNAGYNLSGPSKVVVSGATNATYQVHQFRSHLTPLQFDIAELDLSVQVANLAVQRLAIKASTRLQPPYVATLDIAANNPGNTTAAKLNVHWSGDTKRLPDSELALNVSHLGDWLPEAQGKLNLDAKLSTSANGVPTLIARGDMRQLAWQDYRLKTANLNANLNLQPQGAAVIALNASQLVAANQSVESLVVSLTGNTDKHTLKIDLDSAISKLNTDLSGGLAFTAAGKVDGWAGQFSHLKIDQSGLGRLHLNSLAGIAVSKRAVEIKNACIQFEKIEQANLCASGRLTETGQVSAALSELRLPLASTTAFVEGLESRGMLQGRGVIGGNLNEPNSLIAELSLALGKGGFSQTGARAKDSIPIFGFSQGFARLSYHEKNLDIKLSLDESDKGRVAVTGKSHFGLADLSTLENLPLKLHLFASDMPIAWLQQGLPDVSDLEGSLSADIRIDGTLGKPNASGDLTVSGDRLTVPSVGLSLKQWKVAARPAGSNVDATLSLTADDGGTLSANLRGELLGTGVIEGDVSGKRFPLYQTPDAQIWADPKLQLRYENNLLTVGGRVDVDKAMIAPSISFKSTGSKIAISEDQVMVDEQGQAVESGGGVGLSADVTIAFGSDVRIKAYGLETALGGKLQVIETPGRLTRGRGEIKLIDGQYAAFGQPLKISRGALLFQNTLLTQPALDVTAVREFDEVTVGVNARGTIQTPELELFSTPSLSQSDQLSWLVLGRPFDREASSSDNDDALAAATRALQLQGAEFLTGKLSSRLGIEDVALESTDDGSGSALVLGKYLSPRLYLSYGLGLFDTRNQLKLKYQIGRDWAFEAASDGIDSGGDIFYEREK